MDQDQRVKVLMAAGLSEPDAQAGLDALDSGRESLQADRARRVLQTDHDAFATFLTARIHEDAAGHVAVFYAGGTRCGRCVVTYGYPIPENHPEPWPCRSHREVEAKRAILDEHTCRCPDDCGECGACSGEHHADPTPSPCLTLKALAAVYVDHPDYRDEWRA